MGEGVCCEEVAEFIIPSRLWNSYQRDQRHAQKNDTQANRKDSEHPPAGHATKCKFE